MGWVGSNSDYKAISVQLQLQLPAGTELGKKYLGVLISKDGKNMKNIKERVAKGTGIVKRIMTILDSIPLGKHYFEVGMLLRDSLLISSILYNAEAWYNLSNTELNLIETVDLMFFHVN